MTSNEPGHVVQGLQACKAKLSDRLWMVATEIADGGGPEVLTQLVRLKADIEAIEFAIANAPQSDPEEDAKVVSIRG